MADRVKLFWAINGEKILLVLLLIVLGINAWETHQAGEHSAENNRILIEREKFVQQSNRDHAELLKRCQ